MSSERILHAASASRRSPFAQGLVSLVVAAVGLTGCASAGNAPASSPSATALYTVTASPTDKEMLPADSQEMDAAAEKALKESSDGPPGLYIGIWDPAKGYHVGAYGKAALGGPRATAADHGFIGSVTKTATAVAVLDQVAAGRIALSDTVATIDPDLAAQFPPVADVTVERLLNMSSGIPDYANQEDTGVIPVLLKDPQHEFSQDDLIREGLDAAALEPVGTPGYSTTNYIVLGKILQKVTGRTPQDLVTDVFDRLGMSDSALPEPPDLPPAPRTSGYFGAEEATTYAQKGFDYTATTDVTGWNRSWAREGGGAYSAVADLKTYAQTALGTTLLPADLGAQRLTPASVLPESVLFGPYGMGIFRNGDWVGHSGQLIGWEANVWFNLTTGAVYVAMTNSSDGLVTADTVASEYFPDLFTGWSPSKSELAAIPNQPQDS